jgi:hypothetical protein
LPQLLRSAGLQGPSRSRVKRRWLTRAPKFLPIDIVDIAIEWHCLANRNAQPTHERIFGQPRCGSRAERRALQLVPHARRLSSGWGLRGVWDACLSWPRSRRGLFLVGKAGQSQCEAATGSSRKLRPHYSQAGSKHSLPVRRSGWAVFRRVWPSPEYVPPMATFPVRNAATIKLRVRDLRAVRCRPAQSSPALPQN